MQRFTHTGVVVPYRRCLESLEVEHTQICVVVLYGWYLQSALEVKHMLTGGVVAPHSWRLESTLEVKHMLTRVVALHVWYLETALKVEHTEMWRK